VTKVIEKDKQKNDGGVKKKDEETELVSLSYPSNLHVSKPKTPTNR
jgi:hypothetical protein